MIDIADCILWESLILHRKVEALYRIPYAEFFRGLAVSGQVVTVVPENRTVEYLEDLSGGFAQKTRALTSMECEILDRLRTPNVFERVPIVWENLELRRTRNNQRILHGVDKTGVYAYTVLASERYDVLITISRDCQILGQRQPIDTEIPILAELFKGSVSDHKGSSP